LEGFDVLAPAVDVGALWAIATTGRERTAIEKVKDFNIGNFPLGQVNNVTSLEGPENQSPRK
jgi:hypothetical protein